MRLEVQQLYGGFDMSTLSQRTQDLDEAMELVRSVYCPHDLVLGAGQRRINTQLSVERAQNTAIVQLAYGADVVVDAGHFDDIFLVMKCLSGWGQVVQDGERMQWGGGNILPVSTNRPTQFEFSAAFEQISIRPDKQRLQALCSHWLGHPLESDLRFALIPFSAPLRDAWNGSLDLLMHASNRLPEPAVRSLEEALFSLVLTAHPHNYSAQLQRPEALPASRLVRRFEQLVHEHDDQELTVGFIATQLNVGLRSLQYAVQKELHTTPQIYLRDIRLERVRRALERQQGTESIAEIAYAHGFAHLGRFAGFYQKKFGEKPSDTVFRARGGKSQA